MSVENFNPSQQSIASTISVTPQAAEHFRLQLQKSQKAAIRLSLKESGCTGFMYVMDEVASPQEKDIDIPLENGVHLYIDPANIVALRGLEVDYVQQGLNKNLIMNNPNVKDACGCGESFSFEEQA